MYQQGYEKGFPDSSGISKYVFYSNDMGSGPGANIPPKLSNCYVQIRLYLQDVKSGKILWNNRIETRFTPPSTLAYDDNQPKKMTDDSISKAVDTLLEDLFKDKKKEKFLGLL